VERILDYIIREKISDSKNSLVYRALSKRNRIEVVLKLFKAEYPSPMEAARFTREYEILKKLDIDGIVRPYDVIRVDGKVGLVMEHFPGLTLAAMLKGQRLSLKKALELGVSIAGTITDLHKAGVTHGGIRPDNVLVGPGTSGVKLTDFGIAREITHEDRDLYHPEVIERYLPYISPEQSGRMGLRADRRTDLYSFGVVLYQMLTGTLPFLSNDPLEIIHAHMVQEPVPPAALRKRIPKTLSDIVMKLLSKAAEDRYRSASGLVGDLKECLERCSGQGRFEPFRNDPALGIDMPQRLAGRDRETGILLAGFDEACRGGVKVLLVRGGPGVGKSALINEVRKPAAGHRAWFASGAFDRFRYHVPCSAIVQAFGKVAAQIECEGETRLDAWKKDLLSALGRDARVITDIMPVMEGILGKQPELDKLGPEEEQVRFCRAFAGLVRVLATAEHPLVLFLDDLQWADPASLKLITSLLACRDIGHLYLIGAFRDEEGGPPRELMDTVSEIRSLGTRMDEIVLKPLMPGDVGEIVAAMLGCPAQRVASLAGVIHARTGGNPFFVCQLVSSLFKQGAISLDPEAGMTWDEERIASMETPGCALELLSGRISGLDKGLREMLEVCACAGNRFDLETLSIIVNKPLSQTLEILAGLMDEGLVYYGGGELYHFAHERVQEAVYILMPEARRRELHYKIGRLVYENASPVEMLEKIYYIVGQLNLGKGVAPSGEEGTDLVRLNLAAARKAKRSTAHHAAVAYLEAALALMAGQGWQSDYDLAFNLHRDLAESAFLSLDFARAAEIFSIVLEKARTRTEYAEVCRTLVALKMSSGRPWEALAHGTEGLKKLGLDLAGEGLGGLSWSAIETHASEGGAGLKGIVDSLCTEGAEGEAVLELLAATARAGRFTEELEELMPCPAQSDMGTLKKALEELISHCEGGTLAARAISIAVRLAGAGKGCLLLAGEADGPAGLSVAAGHDARGHAAGSGPLATGPCLEYSPAVVRHVMRTGMGIVVGAGAGSGIPCVHGEDYRADPGVKSVLCLPLKGPRRGGPLGVIYLQSGLPADAYTPAVREMLEIFSLFAACRLEASGRAARRSAALCTASSSP